jgi:hypothetical protein
MRDFLFDTPYWFLGLLGVVGAALWVSAKTRSDRRKEAAILAFAAAVALGLLSYFVDTDKKKVEKRTRQLVEAVAKQDKAVAENLLHPQANLGGLKKPAIVERIGTAADQFHIKGLRITSIEVHPAGDDLSALIAVTADAEMGGFGGGVPSTWDLVWEKSASGWLLRDIRPVSMPGGFDLKGLIGRFGGE